MKVTLSLDIHIIMHYAQQLPKTGKALQMYWSKIGNNTNYNINVKLNTVTLKGPATDYLAMVGIIWALTTNRKPIWIIQYWCQIRPSRLGTNVSYKWPVLAFLGQVMYILTTNRYEAVQMYSEVKVNSTANNVISAGLHGLLASI